MFNASCQSFKVESREERQQTFADLCFLEDPQQRGADLTVCGDVELNLYELVTEVLLQSPQTRSLTYRKQTLDKEFACSI